MSQPTLAAEAIRRLQTVGLQWATYSVVGSFVLYVLGYLTIRFHLTVLGVGADLAVIDERYLFGGAKFLVYLVSAVVTLLLLMLVPAGLGYATYRLVSRLHGLGSATPESSASRPRAWCISPTRLLIAGIILSIVAIQLVMKQCFFFGNLLVARHLPPQAAWLSDLMVREDDLPITLFFAGLVASVTITGSLLVLAGRSRGGTGAGALFWLLTFLVAVQLLLLPVNYGALIADMTLPRVASLDGEIPLRPGDDAWLVWEGESGVTYLLRRGLGEARTRSLVTLRRSEVKRTEIVGYDKILWEVFGRK
jgi:hypothetical protein